MRLVPILLLALAAVAPACGLTQTQVDLFADYNTAMASEWSDLSASFYSLVDAVEKASPDGSVTKAKMAEAKEYIRQKDAKFTTLVGDVQEAILASKQLDDARKQALLNDLFKVIDAIQAKNAGGA